MQYLTYLALAASFASAVSVQEQTPLIAADQYLVELSPGNTRWVTEEEKWELRRNGRNFMDITETKQTYPEVSTNQRIKVKYPSEPQHNKTVKALAKELEKKNMRSHLEKFTSFHTRYYKSETGRQSALWLHDQILDTVKSSGAHKHGATVRLFDHPWGQPSIIASLPGKSNRTVVVSAHQDSINLFLPSILAAPGADDDGSGTVTILEALRVLLTSDDVSHAQAENTIEFHWYSAEEGGLLGSQAVYASYAADGREVVAMLQNDMTGYTATTLERGKPESVGVVTDFVDPDLTEFIKKIITTYCDIPYVLTKCGYACSDHASASKYGYPSAFVIESTFEDSNTQRIHTGNDKIEYLSFDHMLQHAKMTLAFVYELGSADI